MEEHKVVCTCIKNYRDKSGGDSFTLYLFEDGIFRIHLEGGIVLEGCKEELILELRHDSEFNHYYGVVFNKYRLSAYEAGCVRRWLRGENPMEEDDDYYYLDND